MAEWWAPREMCDNMWVRGDASLEELPELLGGFQVGLAASVAAEGALYGVNIVFSYPGSKKTTGQINSRKKKIISPGLKCPVSELCS